MRRNDPSAGAERLASYPQTLLGLEPTPRSYQSWVADETIEDYALRYAPRAFRRWTPANIARTAVGGISFLALEAIGAALTITWGVQTTVISVLLVSVFIFVTSLPIAYHAARSNVDMDLLTRGAGFGYIGSAVTSLIYASYTIIFFAIEGVIIGQALLVCFGLPLPLGYLLSTIAILPLAAKGMTSISVFQSTTHLPWIVLAVLPFAAIALTAPATFPDWLAEPGPDVSLLSVGSAVGVLCALTLQIGEQVDYLRFLPPKESMPRARWWGALLLAGPGWIVIGGLKIIMGSFLVTIAIAAGMSPEFAIEPIGMFWNAFGYLFDTQVALVVATVYILLAQAKINVTNAYAGSLAESNFFLRVTRYHPGRLVWLLLHVTTSCALMLMGVFSTLEVVLAIYANLAMAWMGAIFTDLAILKPAGLSPSKIEFKRAHLPDFNPVGCGGMAVGSVTGCLLYLDIAGPMLQAWSAPVAFAASVGTAGIIALIRQGHGYIARRPHVFPEPASCKCAICSHGYEAEDMAYCTFYERPICSLCCSLEPHCRDYCKRPVPDLTEDLTVPKPPMQFQFKVSPQLRRRFWQIGAVFLILMVGLASVYPVASYVSANIPDRSTLTSFYLGMVPVLLVLAFWIVMAIERRRLTEEDLIGALLRLNLAQRELAINQRLAAIGEVAATISHELRNPLGTITSSVEVLARSSGLGVDDQEDVDRIKRNIRRCSRIIDMLLDFARQGPCDPVRIKLRAWLETVVADHSAREFVVLEVADSLQLHCDPTQMQFAICNLLDNAIQAIESVDPPTKAPQITLRAVHHAGEILIEVSDNGPGLDPELRARAFDPLVSSKSRGVGLGLPLVRRVAQLHGGEVRIRNTGPDGTHMQINLPAVT